MAAPGPLSQFLMDGQGRQRLGKFAASVGGAKAHASEAGAVKAGSVKKKRDM